MRVHPPQVPEGTHLFATSLYPTAQGWGVQAALQCHANGEGAGGASLTRRGPRQPCPAGTASCGWCTPASPSAARGPPARNRSFTSTRARALAAPSRGRQPGPHCGLAGEGGSTPRSRPRQSPRGPGPWHELGRDGQKYGGRRSVLKLGSSPQHQRGRYSETEAEARARGPWGPGGDTPAGGRGALA